MERKTAHDFDQDLLILFDAYVHGVIDRRSFLDQASRFAVGGVTAAMLLEQLSPKFIERTVVATVEGRADLLAEVHVVTFPGEAAFAAYRADPRLGALAHLRDGAVVSTEILVGEDGPRYSPR